MSGGCSLLQAPAREDGGRVVLAAGRRRGDGLGRRRGEPGGRSRLKHAVPGDERPARRDVRVVRRLAQPQDGRDAGVGTGEDLGPLGLGPGGERLGDPAAQAVPARAIVLPGGVFVQPEPEEELGVEAGLKGATVILRGRRAYGLLRSEHGVHRLVRISPFDQNHRRHTSFALVEVLPELEEQEEQEVEINPDDLRIDTYRSTGAGGQHVNKTDSAVRITHLPTGIVVTSQNERSQIKNRDSAMKVLRARLHQRQLEEQAKRRERLRGQVLPAEFGSQIRNYVLQPYTLVKDLRSGVEVGNVQAVLEGHLEPFIEGWLRWRVSGKVAAGD